MEQVVGAAVQSRARHNVVARLGDVEQCESLRRLAARGQQRTHTAFERGDALFHRGLRRVHDAGVDVAEFLECEEVSGVIR